MGSEDPWGREEEGVRRSWDLGLAGLGGGKGNLGILRFGRGVGGKGNLGILGLGRGRGKGARRSGDPGVG